MAAYGNYGGEAGDEVGSQFSGAPADVSGQPIAASAFGGFPYYGGLPYTGFGAPAAFPGAYPGAAPAAFGATAFPAAGPVFEQPAYTQVSGLPYAVPTAVPVPVRKPGYNERYVAWKNRQKAFNRYKQATKQAIKNARNVPTNTYALAPATTFVQQQYAAPTYYGLPAATGFAAAAAPTAFGFEQYGSYLPYGTQFAYPAAAPAASFAGEFTSYSEASQAQQEQAAAEEPEIRGTQV